MAVFCVPETGHIARTRVVVRSLVAAGCETIVLSHARFRDSFEGAGAVFFDLYGRYPIEAVDAESYPISCRHVSHAGVFADRIASELGKLDPDLVVYDSFAVVGLVAARLLDLPHVCVLSGHDPDPTRMLGTLSHDPRVSLADACTRAVERLRGELGMPGASPFSYADTMSPHLNVYCEPPEYLTPAERAVFEPVTFFGSLASLDPPPPAPSPFGPAAGDTLRIYVSFGTVIWRSFTSAADGAFEAIGRALGGREDVRILVSLGDGGHAPPAALDAPNIFVRNYVDQWRVLHEADVFVTHHGLNSTHEAAACGVPMLSYPIFWDQPALASRCAELGLAASLAPPGSAPCAPVSAADVQRALATLEARRDTVRARLAEAREWERRVIDAREEGTERILATARR